MKNCLKNLVPPGSIASFPLTSVKRWAPQWCYRWAEEAHQALEILRRGQEELFSHELQSSQTQSTQPDLIL